MATPLAPGGLISALALRQPVGVVACITSYNFPLVNMAGKVAPALAMGNTVVVKPAAQDPLTVVELVRILDEVGFPPGVVNLVNSADAGPAAALVDSTDVDMISFTGSTEVGTRIASAGGRTMKRLLLELGGKGACIVFDDAKLDAAVGCIGSTWSFHSGQICTAPTRAIVQRGVFDQVLEMLRGYAGALKVGDPTELDTIVGPLISAAQRDRVEGHIATGRDEGARLVAGGGRPAHMERGFYIEPTLFVADNDMAVAREEIFGPVLVGHPLRRRGRGDRHRQRQRLRALRLRLLGRHRPGLRGGPAAAGRARRDQHRPAQPRGALRRVQDVGRRARRGRLRPGGVLGAAVDRVDRLRLDDHRRRPG